MIDLWFLGFHRVLTHVTRLKAAVDYIYTAEVPDVILLDLHLPDCEGLEGFKQLKKLVPGSPVIILTNLMDDALAMKAVREGAQDYLIKIGYQCERDRLFLAILFKALCLRYVKNRPLFHS